MNTLVKYVLKNKAVTWLLLALVLFGGLYSYTHMGKLEDAPFTIKQALVMTPYPGASPEEVRNEVTDLLEESIQSLDEELRFADAYLYLHRVRLGNCLGCRMEIPDEVRECSLPPLTLQLLIENVIKHNVITSSHPLEIEIAARDGWLTVSNPIRTKRGAESGGVGLQNLSNRCRMMLGREIEVLRTEDRFTVKIPLSHE